MIQAELFENRIALKADPRENDRIKMCPGAAWNRKHLIWETNLSWAACITLRAIFGEQLVLGPDLMAWATHERERVDACMTLRQASDVEGVWDHED